MKKPISLTLGRIPGTALLFLLSGVVAAPNGYAHVVSTADDLCSPTADPCNTCTSDHSVVAGSVLDFGARAVVVKGKLIVDPGGSMKILCGNLTANKQLRADGGEIHVEASGDIIIGAPGILVQDTSGAGVVHLNAGGDILIDGDILADGTGTGGNADGGDVTITAEGTVTIDNKINATGQGQADGGSIEIESATDAVNITKFLKTFGGFSGGSIRVVAETDLVVSGGLIEINANATASEGTAGSILLEATSGNLTIDEPIYAEATDPDGEAGDITLIAGGLINLSSTIRGTGHSDGSSIEMSAGSITLQSGGKIISHGKGPDSLGGSVDLSADKDIAIAGLIDVNGATADASGGTITMQACSIDVQTAADLEAKAGSNSSEGGRITLSGSNKTVVSGNLVATPGGAITIGYKDSTPTVTGTVDPSNTNRSQTWLASCCGNGVQEPAEACDPAATPTGCSGALNCVAAGQVGACTCVP